MKITFIDPPNLLGKSSFERVFGCTYSLYPIPNIFSLSNAAVLEKEGFAVRYIDMANERWGQKRFKDFLRSDDSGAYVLYSVNLSLRSDLLAHAWIRNARAGIPVIFSGPAPTYFTESFLRDPATFAVRGESEFTLLELLRCLQNKEALKEIAGLSYLSASGIVHNLARPLIEDLDKLPFPARHLLQTKLYYNPKLCPTPFTAVQTSRNCSHRCAFCVPNSYNFSRELEYRKYNSNAKPPVRVRSAAGVTEEFRLLKAAGYKSVSIIDDQFLWDESRTIAICDGIKPYGIDWGCLARADRLSDKVAAHLAAAGCRYVDIGVESFDQAVLDDIKKDLKVERVFEAIRILKNHKILAKINLVLGISPLQTKEKIAEDIRMAKKMDVDAVMFSLATPFPGTEFYSRAKENNWFVEGGYYPESVQNKAIINYPGLSYKELNVMVRTANIAFYFSPRFILKNLKRIWLTPANFCRSLIALKRKFF